MNITNDEYKMICKYVDSIEKNNEEIEKILESMRSDLLNSKLCTPDGNTTHPFDLSSN